MSPLPDHMFKQLGQEEEKVFRKWARDNYIPFSPIEDIWHPVVRDECHKMNNEFLERSKNRGEEVSL